MTAVSSAALTDAAMEACRNHAALRTPETWSAFVAARAHLAAALDSERQARENAERERDALSLYISEVEIVTCRAEAAERRELTLESGRLTLMARAEQAERERDEARLENADLEQEVADMTAGQTEALRQLAAAEAARDRLTEALNALNLAAGYYRRELKEILAHCEDGGQALAISKIRAHAQDAIRAADASLAAAGSGGTNSAPDLLGTSTQSEGFPEGNDGETGAGNNG